MPENPGPNLAAAAGIPVRTALTSAQNRSIAAGSARQNASVSAAPL
uniref:Uncharacterized protein n=1 Tax=Escherichia coli TaxID=562 RepID=A0A2S0T0S5_ECOLX|nr:hypothetical protein [Escherichia coli]